MPELSGLSKHLIQQLSLSGIKAPSPQAGFVLLGAEEWAERGTPPGFRPLPSPELCENKEIYKARIPTTRC